ncbi:MAG: HD domain-containing protein [Spirochaetaceae bacterium]|nr:HD domain-containing protein [Spirochaetaceae bacterium]
MKHDRNKKVEILAGKTADDYHGGGAAFFEKAAGGILKNDAFLKCRNYIQHGKTSTYKHCLEVAKMCDKLGRFLNVKDRESMIRAALLHDFFLYDWHNGHNSWHGFTHPAAAENAKKHFNVSEKEYSMIQTHMWPLTLFHPPKYKEGWLICAADKIISVKEIFKAALHRPRRRLPAESNALKHTIPRYRYEMSK